MTIGRNDSCPCGSGKKYKKCCLSQDEAQRVRNTHPDPHYLAELRPDVDDAVDRALQRLERGEGQRAKAELEQLLESYPNYHMTNYAMGLYHAMVAKDVRAAIPYFEKATAILPPFPEAHFNLGMAARQSLDIAKSIEAFRAAERYSRDDQIAQMARKELKRFETMLLKDGAFKSLDAYIANAKLFDRAFEFLQQRQFHRAVELFQQVLKDNPKHVQSYGNLALAYAGLGRRQDALDCIDRALKFDPSYEPALANRLVIAEMKEGEPGLAVTVKQVEFYAERFRANTGR